jgi:hypothetical protein
MTTYNNKHYNNKTRKIKLFKGGAFEDDITKTAIDKVVQEISPKKIDDLIKNPAIDKVTTEISSIPGVSSSTPVKSGKNVSILIDFYNKLLKTDDYGKKLENFNKFYEIININKNGINMTESITGVEELFKIFNNELEYIKATDAEKEIKKKNLSSNHEKTKEINIDYKNGDYSISDAPGGISSGVSEPVAAASSPVTLGTTGTPGLTVTNPGKALIIDENIQETAKNVVFDEVIMELVKTDLNTNSLIPDSKLEKLYDEIAKLTKEINKNNNSIKDEQSKIKINDTKVEKLKKIEDYYKSQSPNGKLQQKNLAMKISINNTKITEIETKITDSKNKITNAQEENIRINGSLVPLNSEKEHYLKLLNRAYDILTKKLSSVEATVGNVRVYIKHNDKKTILNNMKMIRNKIYKLTHETWMKTSQPTSVPISTTSPSPIIPETAITNAAIKAVNDAVKPKNKSRGFIPPSIGSNFGNLANMFSTR